MLVILDESSIKTVDLGVANLGSNGIRYNFTTL